MNRLLPVEGNRASSANVPVGQATQAAIHGKAWLVNSNVNSGVCVSQDKTGKDRPSLRADARLKAAVAKLAEEPAPREMTDHALRVSGEAKARGDRRS